MSVRSVIVASGLALGITGTALLLANVPQFAGASRAAASGIELMAELSGGPVRPAVDVDNLVRIGGRDYAVTFEDGISAQAYSSTQVRRIGYGVETVVDIAYTPTGTYSTDGFASPHVVYPGVTVERVAATGPLLLGPSFAYVPFPAREVVTFVPLPDGLAVVSGGESCVVTPAYRVCR